MKFPNKEGFLEKAFFMPKCNNSFFIGIVSIVCKF